MPLGVISDRRLNDSASRIRDMSGARTGLRGDAGHRRQRDTGVSGVAEARVESRHVPLADVHDSSAALAINGHRPETSTTAATTP